MSAFSDVIMQNMVSSLNPEAAMLKQATATFVQKQEIETQTAKAEAIADISDRITQAQANGADDAVVNAYKKILNKLTA